MAEAIERGFPVERALLLAAEALLRAVHGAEPALVAREVERVLALLAVGYPRFFEGRTAA